MVVNKNTVTFKRRYYSKYGNGVNKKGGNMLENVKTWLFSVALKKATSNIVKVAAAWIMSSAILSIAKQYGVEINIDKATLEAAMTAFITGGIEMLRNYLKVKFPALGKVL